MSAPAFIIGIDLGNDEHAVCVLNSQRQVVRKIQKFGSDLAIVEFISKATGDTPPRDVHVGMEDRNNVVADELMRRGFKVFTANPKTIDRFRDRETVAGAKDDRRDASVIANALLSDPQVFLQADVEQEPAVRLNVLMSTLAQIDADRRSLANQLRASVLRYLPVVLQVCEAADAPWFWDLLLCLGDADKAPRVRPATIATLLKKHRLRKVKADDVVALLRKPFCKASAAISVNERERAKSLVRRLAVVHAERTRLNQERIALVEELGQPKADGAPSDMGILLSMPGMGPSTGGALYADCLGLLLNGELAQLRGKTGVAPVTKQSGKFRPDIVMRFACNWNLREAVHHAANSAVLRASRFKTKYDVLKARGHGHARALRGVADLMLHILVGMFKTRTPYVEGYAASR